MRQESHRIYLQTFAPRSASSSSSPSSFGTVSASSSAGSVSSSLSQSSTASGRTFPPPSHHHHHHHHHHGHQARPVLTASAAVRLTDGATTRDVTKLLRAKFGWPPLRYPDPDLAPASPVTTTTTTTTTTLSGKAAGGARVGVAGSGGAIRLGKGTSLDKINARLAEFRGDAVGSVRVDTAGGRTKDNDDDKDDKDGGGNDGGPPIRTIAIAAPSSQPSASSTDASGKRDAFREGRWDALVLIGTVMGLPKHYVRFEHEPEEQEEDDDDDDDDDNNDNDDDDDGEEEAERNLEAEKYAPNLVDENESCGREDDNDFSVSGPAEQIPDTGTSAAHGEGKAVTLEILDPLKLHEGRPERRRMGSVASAKTIKASGAGPQMPEGSALDASQSTMDDSMVGLDLSDSRDVQFAGLDTSSLTPGPPASNTDLFASKQFKDQQRGIHPPAPASSIRNVPMSEHHRRISSGGGLSTTTRNGEPVPSPASTWAESLIGVPRGGVGTVVTEGPHGRQGGAFVAAEPAVRFPRYVQNLDRLGPVDSTPIGGGVGHEHDGLRDRAHAQRQKQRHLHHKQHPHHPHHHHHHREEEYAVSLEPYNLVRTLKPHENPLRVRDDVLRILVERQHRAESECGVLPRRKRRAPAFRWFFQPCVGWNDVGGSGGGGNVRTRTVPSCVDVDGYCSGAESSDDDDNDDDEDDDGVGASDGFEDGDGGSNNHSPNNGEVDREKGTNEFAIRPYWRDEALDLFGCHHHYSRFSSKDDFAVASAKHLDGGLSPYRPRRRTGFVGSRLADERHKLTVLSQREGTAGVGDGQCVSGYLLKRSRSDPNVWRRVHCVLTDDQMWYVSRVRPLGDVGTDCTVSIGGIGNLRHQQRPPISPGRHPTASSPAQRVGPNAGKERQGSHGENTAGRACTAKPKRIGRHRVIRLTRSLLVESDPASRTSNPLSRTPNSFEICTARGEVHVFRAMRRSVQRRWVECLVARIVRGHEDNFMELADLIVAEETHARGRRMEELAVLPIIEYGTFSSLRRPDGGGGHQQGGECSLFGQRAAEEILLNAVRFGADVAEYKELCRRALAANTFGRLSVGGAGIRLQNGAAPARKDESTDEEGTQRRGKELALSAWESAEDVLSKSHLIVRALGGGSTLVQSEKSDERCGQDPGDKVCAEGESQTWSDITSIQRQISDLIEEGRVKILVGSPTSPTNSDFGMNGNETQFPAAVDRLLPPEELFDVLLSVLQRISTDRTGESVNGGAGRVK